MDMDYILQVIFTEKKPNTTWDMMGYDISGFKTKDNNLPGQMNPCVLRIQEFVQFPQSWPHVPLNLLLSCNTEPQPENRSDVI